MSELNPILYVLTKYEDKTNPPFCGSFDRINKRLGSGRENLRVSLSPCCYPQRPGWALPSSRPWFVWLSNERNSESRSLVIIRGWGRTGLVPWPTYRVRSLGMRFWNLSFRSINSCVHSCFFLWVQMYEAERLTVCLRSCLTQAILRISPIDTSPL